MEIEDCLVEVQTLFFREERMKATCPEASSWLHGAPVLVEKS